MLKKLFYFFLFTPIIFGQNYELQIAIDNYNNGKFSEAVSVFQKYIDSGSKEKDIFLAASDCYIKLNNYPKAISILEKYRTVFGDEFNINFLLAQLYAQTGNYLPATNILSVLIRNYPDSNSAKIYLSDVFLTVGVTQYGSKDTINAEINFKNSLIYNPFNKQARVNLLILFLESKRYNDALKFAEEGYRFFNNDNNIALIYFEVLIGLENFTDALPVLEVIAKRLPDDIQIQLNLAMLYRYNNSPEKAVQVYENLRKNFPGNKDVFEAEIKYYELFSDDEKIISLYLEYLIYKPDDKEMKLRLAKKYEYTGNFDKAREIYLTLNPNQEDQSINVLIAENYSAAGDLESAISQLLSIIEDKKADPFIYSKLFELFQKSGKIENAKGILLAGLKNFPFSLELNLELVKVYYNEQKFDSAFIVLETISGYSREVPEIPYYFALIYKINNEKTAAIRNYSRAIRVSLKETGRIQTSISGSFNNEAITNPDSAKIIQDEAEKLRVFIYIINSSFADLSTICNNEEFLEVIDNLLSELPQAALIYVEKGKFLLKTGKTAEARQELEKAQILSPSTVEVQEALGEYYEKTGDFENALLSFRRANSLDKENQKYYRKIIDLAVKSNKLDEICDYWLQVYKTSKSNILLKEFLIEALHKANRTKEAIEIIKSN
ncbi:MAG: tetratricopeptide repeat protein [Ignavibacteriaceae bacterium]|nr:tetratricopeptide repeat protein [Ignavibacteriaceae bacterium]